MKMLSQFAAPELILRDLAVAATGKLEDAETEMSIEELRLRYQRAIALIILLSGREMESVNHGCRALAETKEADREKFLNKIGIALPVLTILLIKRA